MIAQAPALATTLATPMSSIAIAPQNPPLLPTQHLPNFLSDVDVNMDLLPIPGQFDVFYGVSIHVS